MEYRLYYIVYATILYCTFVVLNPIGVRPKMIDNWSNVGKNVGNEFLLQHKRMICEPSGPDTGMVEMHVINILMLLWHVTQEEITLHFINYRIK